MHVQLRKQHAMCRLSAPHRELSPGPTAANPPHRIRRKWAAPLVVIWPGQWSQPSARRRCRRFDSQQRVIATPNLQPWWRAPLLGQSVGLADLQSRSMVNGASPGRGQGTRGHPVQVECLAPAKAAQEVPKSGWRPCAADSSRASFATDRRVDVAAGQPRRLQAQPCFRRCYPACAIAQVQVPVNQLGQTHQGFGGRKYQPGIEATRLVANRFVCGRGGCVVASVGCSLFPVGFLSRKPLSQIQRSTWQPYPVRCRCRFPLSAGFGFRNRPNITSCC